MLDPNGIVISWNKGAQRVLGYEESQIIGHSANLLFSPEDLAAGIPRSEMDTAISAGRAAGNRWHIRKDGQRVFINGVALALRDDQGQLSGFARVMRDMTQRVKTEQRLAAQYAVTQILASAESLEDATGQVLGAICLSLDWDWAALWRAPSPNEPLRCVEVYHRDRTATNSFETASRATSLARGVGLPGRVWASGQTEWITDVTTDANFPRRAAAADCGLRGAVCFPVRVDASNVGAVEFISRQLFHPDPDLIRTMGNIGNQLGQFIERKRAENELRQSEALKGGVLSAALDCIIGMDHQGRIIEWNAAAEQTFGHCRAEAVGQILAELIIPQRMREAHWKGLRRYLETGKGPVIGRRIELSALRADGSEFSVEIAITRIQLPGPPLFTAHVRDITEQKKSEQERAEALVREQVARAEAEAANKSKDQFLAVLSHELRTPLTPILAVASMLARDKNLPAGLKEDVEMIRRNVELEARLIDDLLDLTRISQAKLRLFKQKVDIGELVGHVVEMCAIELRAKHIRFSQHMVAERCDVDGDPARLQQVLWNLLKNAIKFTPEGGSIAIQSRCEDQKLILSIADSGIGIDPQLLPKLFNAFEQGSPTVTRQFGGLGLGLAISKALIDAHGGKLEAHSEGIGHGATFTIQLPLTPSSKSKDATRGPAAPMATAHPLRILLVEDHGDTQQMMVRLLEGSGHQVRTADCVNSALDVAATCQFDLVISDLGLPDGSGLDLMHQLRKRHGICGIALSGYGMEIDIQRSREAGFAHHLTKPVTPDGLEAAIWQVVGPTQQRQTAQFDHNRPSGR
jgi:PAS domain S-box-containing protein